MKKSYLIAVSIALLATAWMVTGEHDAEKTKPAPAPKTAETTQSQPPRVKVQRFHAQAMAGEISLNGKTKASRSVNLLSETEGRVVETLVEKGSPVKAGALIARVDVQDREALVARARERVEQMKIESIAQEGLAEKGYNSKTRLAETRAGVEAARAELKRAEVDLANTAIKAPFDGVLEERTIEIGSVLQKGTPVGKVVDLDPMTVTGWVGEQDIAHVKTGQEAIAVLPDGAEVKGKVSYVSVTANEATRTFNVEAEIPNPEGRIVEGLTARLRLPTGEKPAYTLTPAILNLADDGTVGVKTVGDDGLVHFVPVRVLRKSAEGVWVEGLTDGARVIVTGQDFVKEGEKAEAVEESAPKAPTPETPAPEAPTATPSPTNTHEAP